MSTITLLGLSINHLMDRGLCVPVDRVFSSIDDGSILRLLNTLGDDAVSMEGVRRLQDGQYDAATLVEALQRLANAVVPEDLGLHNGEHTNGLLFLAALLNQLVQQSVKSVDLD